MIGRFAAGSGLIRALLAVGLASTIAACGAGAPTTNATGTSTPSLPPQRPGAKLPLTGLVDMGSQLFYVSGSAAPVTSLSTLGGTASDFGGIVVNETWAQLEPKKGSEDWTALDASLAAVSSWNASHRSHPLGVKLRVFGGFTAPEWAKSMDGAPITYGSRSIGRWWTVQYRSAWSSFQHALAARYDSIPLVRAVAVTSCASLTGEPFITALTPFTIATMTADGWTPALQQQCLDGILGDYSGWIHTPIDFPFNPFRTLVNGRPSVDFSVTRQVMEACAQSASKGGPTCVLGNHGLQDTAATTSPSAPVYEEINSLWHQTPAHVQVYFQTDGPSKGADCASMNVAIRDHANSVEIWPQAIASNPQSTLASWNRALSYGVPLSC